MAHNRLFDARSVSLRTLKMVINNHCGRQTRNNCAIYMKALHARETDAIHTIMEDFNMSCYEIHYKGALNKLHCITI